MSALETALAAQWAMVPSSLETLLSVADRTNTVTPEVLEAYRAAHADRGERLRVRDGVAILDVSGPLFKKANLFVHVSGATSYEMLMRDLHVALDDPAVNSIMLRVDSPGGEANGCDELAAAIYAARGKKPITAFVSGQACSGGYWIASAADKVIVSDLAMLGSSGVVLGVADRSKADEKSGVVRREFVSSQSPGKRPDPATDVGAAQIQQMVDDLAEVFVAAVAKHRGVDPSTVIEKFGAGGVEIGAKAVAKGMADEIGQFEAAFATLKARGTGRSTRTIGEFFMSNDKTGAAAEGSEKTVDVAKIQADTEVAVMARVKAIMTSEEGKAMPLQAAYFAYETKISAEVAIAAMKVGKADVAVAAPAVDGVLDDKAFEKKQADAGALGLASPESREAEKKVQDGWSKAAAQANARFGDAGVK
jgi:signal peptide peptidase SppA